MEKNFSPKEVESKIYALWQELGVFTPKIEPGKKPFTILLPPPNANADLHLGHAMYAVEDVLIRWHRMMGDPTLWLPGADHAGFETQVVYEKQLAKEGKSRFDFDRTTLYQNIWDFVQKNKATMESQVKRLGFSLDWSREVFTLDEKIIKTVYKTFKRMYEEGLLYRDARLVNYCTKHGTGFSDLEVDHEERDDFLYYIELKVEGEEEGLVIATARPETIPGDVGVAVHPDDKRYEKYVGKLAINPLDGRKMPIIADGFVKMDFGTGAVKLTSAHDENDFEVCRKHKLPLIQVIGYNGKLTKEAGEFAGLKVLEARERILEKLKEKNLFIKHLPHKHSVALCYKCQSVLEPLPLPQWYIKTEPLAKKALDAVKNGEIKIVPKRFEKIYNHWLNNIKDWNISRQIVWGIRIPAWQCEECKEWAVTEGPTPASCEKCNSAKLVQDPDTFDTWFSSGQWPFATLGFPDSEDYKYFYPTSVLETAYDILFFWVARMIMLGIYATGKTPFEVVYLHGLVRDSKGQKMSKSKGNVINPMMMLDKYGADAVRFGLIMANLPGVDQNLMESKFIAARNFANKVWNIGRFLEMMLLESDTPSSGALTSFEDLDKKNLNEADKKILGSFEKVVKSVNSSLKRFRLADAEDFIYHFMWHELADTYIEDVKNREGVSKSTGLCVLKHIYLNCLKLLHPFMPFVTEEIWSKMKKPDDSQLIVTKWPSKV